MIRPYLVYCPPYTVLSAGIVVMHRLANELHARGLPVFINEQEQNPKWDRLPVITRMEGEAIAVYPEIVSENPFGCGRIVRYLLNKPGFWKSVQYYDTDILFVYSDFWNEEIELHLPKERVLNLNAINEAEWQDYGWVRNIDLWYQGKGSGPFDQHPVSAVNLPRECPEGWDQNTWMKQMLGRCKTFYCYDNATALADIASLCGCKVVYFPDPRMTKKPRDLDNIRQWYKDNEIEFQKKLDGFIRITQEAP